MFSKIKNPVIIGQYNSFRHEKIGRTSYIMLGTPGGSQDDEDQNSFDHITWVKMNKGVPTLSHLRMDGILNEEGNIPLRGDTLSFQAYKPHLIP